MPNPPTVEQIDEAILASTEFASMTVDGETVSQQSLDALMRARKELQREEEIASGTRGSSFIFDLGRQSY